MYRSSGSLSTTQAQIHTETASPHNAKQQKKKAHYQQSQRACHQQWGTKTQRPESSLFFSLNIWVFFCVLKISEKENKVKLQMAKWNVEQRHIWSVVGLHFVPDVSGRGRLSLVEAWTAWPTLTEASLSLSTRERLWPQLGYKSTSLKLEEHLVAKWGVRPQMWTMTFSLILPCDPSR